MRILFRILPLISLVALSALLAPARPGGAASDAVITVSTTNDELNTDTDCSLREAIRAANTNNFVSGCPRGSIGTDTIMLPAGFYQLTRTGADEDGAMTGDLDIQGDLIIQGSGQELSVIDGNLTDRVFHVITGASVDIRQVTIQNGNATSGFLVGGGGVLNQGTVTLSDVSIQNNHATVVGGGIENYHGDATVINSSFSNNSSTEDGGGIFNDGQLFIESSTISGNTALSGGGGLDNRGSATVLNVTISGNTAQEGGGIFNDGEELFVLFSSVVANTALAATGDKGGNIETAESFRVKTSIVANSLAGPNCAGDGVIISEGHNLENTNTCNFIAPTDLFNITDPKIGPLADNGGPTLTHALQEGSPAIETGNDIDCPGGDQRGFSRPADGDGGGAAVCDIGAYEYYMSIFTPLIVR